MLIYSMSVAVDGFIADREGATRSSAMSSVTGGRNGVPPPTTTG